MGILRIVFRFMLGKTWKFVVFWLRILSIVFAGILSLGIFLTSQNVVTVTDKLQKLVWVVAVIIIAVDNAGTLITRRVRKDRSTTQNDIDAILMQFFSGVSKSKRARFEELGASVWVKKSIKSAQFWRSKETELKRIRRFRGMDYPHQSGIAFTSRMGVVGECWTSRRRQYRNLMSHSKKYHPEALSGLTQEAYDRISVNSQMGFSLEEFKATSGKYSEVAASPIFSVKSPNKLLGVLSIDRAMPQNGNEDKFHPALDQPRTREDIEVIVKLIAKVLERRD